MSCNCQKPTSAGESFACSCDQFVHPPALHIDAGLSDLPRQVAGFPEFRRAMLFAIRRHPALKAWRARDDDDFGVMLLEMWAYVCDSLSFYDRLIAEETYLRTAKLRPSLRRLVALLGYLPRPAVAATVQLAARADGRQPVSLGAGTAFRSSAFPGSAPQVFELDAAAVIHPFLNRWTLLPPHPGVVVTANPRALLLLPAAELRPDSVLLLLDAGDVGQNQVLRLESSGPHTGADGQLYTRLILHEPARLAVGTPLARLTLLIASQSTGLWTGPGDALSGQTVALDRIQAALRAGEYVAIHRHNGRARWFRLTAVATTTRYLTTESDTENTIVINSSTFHLPRTPQPLTQLTLDAGLNAAARKGAGAPDWTNSHRSELRVYHGFVPAGRLVDEAQTTVAPTDPLHFRPPVEPFDPGSDRRTLLLTDKNRRGIAVRGRLAPPPNARLEPDPGEGWMPELTLPVEVFGNVLTASRGESVRQEILGSGSAGLPNQSFKLKKKPLTYLLAPSAANDQGIASTLVVYVDGLRWTEVPSFFGRKPGDQVYIVRQNDEGDSILTFGDGIRGQRLPTGADNVVASYRFGAGAVSPPAHTITQIARPVPGLASIGQPLAAAGGADAEGSEGLRRFAPRSALILGRAVSILDMEAVAATIPGVRAVQTEWRWHGQRQRAGVHIWYVGEAGIEASVALRLYNVTDPTTPISVERAEPVPATLAIDVRVDERYIEANVLAAIRARLTDPLTGLLAPERIGIGRPLFRSRLFAEVLTVEGAAAIQSISWDSRPFLRFAQSPGAGHYFDLEQGRLLLNGTA